MKPGIDLFIRSRYYQKQKLKLETLFYNNMKSLLRGLPCIFTTNGTLRCLCKIFVTMAFHIQQVCDYKEIKCKNTSEWRNKQKHLTEKKPVLPVVQPAFDLSRIKRRWQQRPNRAIFTFYTENVWNRLLGLFITDHCFVQSNLKLNF